MADSFSYDDANATTFSYEDAGGATPKTGGLRKLADIGVSFAGGAVGATKAIADAGGAGNAVSRRFDGAQDGVQSLLSPARQAEKAARAQTIADAEKSGSVLRELGAHLGGFAEAPVSTVAEAAGSVVPVVGAMLTPAGRSAAGRTLLGVGLGAAQGAGAVKGSIYDAVKQGHAEQGATPEAAQQAAQQAQAYTGPNAGSIALGAGLGAVAATSGVEGVVSRAMAGRAAAGGASMVRRAAVGAVAEGVPEAVQGGQERLASNLALQEEGFDTPTWRGVAGQAAAEGLAGGVLGGGVNAASRGHALPAAGRAEPSGTDLSEAPVTDVGAAPAAPVIDPTAGPLSKAAAQAVNVPTAPEQLSPDEVRAFNNAYRRDVPAPLEELQRSVRSGTAYTTPADAQGVSQSVEDAWLQANVADEAVDTADVAAGPAGEPDDFIEQAIGQTDAKVRDRRILSALQNLVDEPVNGTAAALQSLDASLSRVGEAVLSGPERERVQRMMGAHAAFTGRTDAVPLPGFVEPAVDAGADNAAMEALIPERGQSAGRAAARVPRAWPQRDQVAEAPPTVARPSTWRSNAIAANKVARDLGLNPKGKQLAAVVGEIDAADAARAGRPHTASDMSAGQIDREWSAFAADTGTLGVPRAQMPQIKSGHRGALVNFLKARGIAGRPQELPAADLKPTQAEFSPERVERARQRKGGDRSILISSDGYVVDGHHQWLAKRADGLPVNVIRLNAPIRQVLGQVAEFPSTTTDGESLQAAADLTAPGTELEAEQRPDLPSATVARTEGPAQAQASASSAGTAMRGGGLSAADRIDQLEVDARQAEARAANWSGREYWPNNTPLPQYEAAGGPVDVQEANEQRRLKAVMDARAAAASARAAAEALFQQGNIEAQLAGQFLDDERAPGKTSGEQRAQTVAKEGAARRALQRDAGERWAGMTAAQRQALAQGAADLNALAKKTAPARAWEDLSEKVRGHLADAMQSPPAREVEGAGSISAASTVARDADPDMVVFNTRGEAPESGLSLEQTQQAVQQALAGLWNPPPVQVVLRSAELSINAPDGVMGAAIPGEGRIVIVASAHRSADAVVETLFHEMFHLGVRNVLPDVDYVQAMLDLAKRDARVQQYAIEWKQHASDAPMQLEVLRDLGYRGSDLNARYEALAIEEGLAVVAEELRAQKQAGTKLGMRVRTLASWLAGLAERMGMQRLADRIRKMTFNEAERFVLRAIDQAGRGPQAVAEGSPDGQKAAADGRADGPRFRTRDGGSVAQRVGAAIKASTMSNLKQQAGFKATDYMSLGLQFLGRRQLVDVYGAMLPELRTYSDLMARMDADKNEAGAGADELATAWSKLDERPNLGLGQAKHPGMERKLAELMHDATLAQIDPAKDYVTGDNRADWLRLRAEYQALSPAGQDVYTRARDTYSKHMRDVRSAIKERIERAGMSSDRKAAMLARMDDEFFGRTKGVYFPLARFGQYVVVVKDVNGKTASVSRAETMAEADTMRGQMIAAFPKDKGFSVGKVLKAKDFVAERDTVGRGFMEQLYGVLDKQGMDAKQRAELEDALGQLYLSSLPDLSWAKHGIHRKGTAGFSQDARRAFAQNVFHGASYLAKLRYGDQLQDQLGEMQRRVDLGAGDAGFDSVKGQQVVDEMAKRHDAAMNPKTNALSTALTSLGFMFHLGLSPASAMVNLTQTALVAYPIMGARWGLRKSGAALLKASQEAVRGKNDITSALSSDEKAAFAEAVRSGVIDVTMAHDLAGIAQGEDRNVSHALQPVMRAASWMFHHAEKFNRQVTFVAAYRLAREAGADQQQGYQQAVQATYDGHFDYSSNNRPRVMQGNVARVLLLFKQYGQNMVYTLVRNAQQSLTAANPEDRAAARKALSGLLTTHAMAAGVLGLPMVTTLLAAASMLGGDDDEPWDAQVAMQNMLADAFGQKPAEVLSHGLSRLTPWDISGRVGLDRLILPDVQEGLEGQRLGESAMAAALGPVAGIGINVLRGLQDMSEGRYQRGLESMAPSALRGPLKALRYETEGVKDKSGIVVQDQVDAAAVAGQAMGFSPSTVRNAYEGKSAIVQHDRALQARRSTLVEQFAMAAMAGDEEGKADARADIAKFNDKNPGRRIQPLQLAQSVRMRTKRIEQAQEGVYLPTKRRDAMAAGRFAVDR